MSKLMLAAVGLLAIATAVEADGVRVEALAVAPPHKVDGEPRVGHEGSTWPETSTCRLIVTCSTGHHTWRTYLMHSFIGNGGSGAAQSVLLCDSTPADCGRFGGNSYLTCTWTNGAPPDCAGYGAFPPPGKGFKHYCHGATTVTVRCAITHN